MVWKIALVVSLLTAIVTAVVAIPVATYVAQANGVSDQDGGRSMAIFFFLMPAAFIAGIVIGLLGTWFVHASVWAQFWKAIGASVGLAMVVLFSIAGYFMLETPITPPAGGSPLVLQVEVYIPVERITTHPNELEPMRMSLYAGPRDNNFAEIDTALTRTENGKVIITATAGLNSTSASRMLSFTLDENTWLALDNLPISARPSETDSVWSALMPMRDARTAEPDYSDVQARVRVVKRDCKP